MITHCRLPLDFDRDRLQEDLERLEGRDWVQHFAPRNYSGNWSALSLRSADGREDNIHTHGEGSDGFLGTSVLEQSPYFRAVLASFRCPLTAVRLMRLAAGSEIKEHVDPGAGYEYGELRLHIPITTNPEVAFMLDGQRVDMLPGECWYLNVALPHSVVNRGPTDRVHLVIDCLVDEWLETMLTDLGFSILEKYGTKARHLARHIRELQRLDSPEAKMALDIMLRQQAELEDARHRAEEQAGPVPNPGPPAP